MQNFEWNDESAVPVLTKTQVVHFLKNSLEHMYSSEAEQSAAPKL